MSRRIAAALALTTLCACPGIEPNVGVAPARPDSRWDSGGWGDSAAALGEVVWIFSGHGGVGEEGVDGTLTHADLAQELEERGLQVTFSEQIISFPSQVRLLVLSAPGFSAAEPWSATEVNLIQAIADSGAVVLLEAENEAVYDPTLAHALLGELSLTMRLAEGYVSGAATPALSDDLTLGVSQVGVQAGAPVEPGSGRCLLELEGRCVAAAEALGDGEVVLLGDGDVLSHLYAWQDAGYDNQNLLLNLARCGWGGC